MGNIFARQFTWKHKSVSPVQKWKTEGIWQAVIMLVFAHFPEHMPKSILCTTYSQAWSCSFPLIPLPPSPTYLSFIHLILVSFLYFQFLWKFTADTGICIHRKTAEQKHSEASTSFWYEMFLYSYQSRHAKFVYYNKNLNRSSFYLRCSLAEWS